MELMSSTAMPAVARASATSVVPAPATSAAPAITVGTTAATTWMRGLVSIEVRFRRFFFGKFGATLQCHRRSRRRSFGWGLAASHFCALFFQNCLARQSDAVAFNGKHLNQNLIALF